MNTTLQNEVIRSNQDFVLSERSESKDRIVGPCKSVPKSISGSEAPACHMHPMRRAGGTRV